MLTLPASYIWAQWELARAEQIFISVPFCPHQSCIFPGIFQRRWKIYFKRWTKNKLRSPYVGFASLQKTLLSLSVILSGRDLRNYDRLETYILQDGSKSDSCAQKLPMVILHIHALSLDLKLEFLVNYVRITIAIVLSRECISLVVHPSRDGDKIRDKAGDDALEQGAVAEYHVSIESLKKVVLWYNCKRILKSFLLNTRKLLPPMKLWLRNIIDWRPVQREPSWHLSLNRMIQPPILLIMSHFLPEIFTKTDILCQLSLSRVSSNRHQQHHFKRPRVSKTDFRPEWRGREKDRE